MTSAEGSIRLEGVSRRFRVYPQESRTLKELVVARGRARGTDVWALRDVSLAIDAGESVGLVGRNGSGKTTLLKLVSGIIKPTSGRVAVAGRVGSLLELGAGFHLDFTGRENVFLNGSILGLSRRDVRRHLDDLHAGGVGDVLVCPIGFVSDHLEVRWDIDTEARARADQLGLDLERIEMPNADPAMIDVLAGVVRRALGVPSPEPAL